MQTKNIMCYPIWRLGSLIGGFNLEKGPWVAGGCARRLWYGESWIPYDVDIFFSCYRSFNESIETLKNLLDFNQLKIATIAKNTGNATSFNIQMHNINENLPPMIKIQAIRLNYYNNIQDVFDDFDITACKFATDGNIVIASDDAIKDCDAKILRLNTPYSRKIKAARVVKYALYGFEPDANVMKEMLSQHTAGRLDLRYEY